MQILSFPLSNITSIALDTTVSTLALISHLQGWDDDKGSYVSQICVGMQAFAIASLADRLLRWFLLEESARPSPAPLLPSIVNPILEETLYSVVLKTEQYKWIVLRLPTSLILGMGAMRSVGIFHSGEFIGGLALAGLREGVLAGAPRAISSPVLMTIDSLLFGLNEVAPAKDSSSSLPKYSSPWFYKLISSVAFRAIAYGSMSRGGWVAPFTQHLLFKASRYLDAGDYSVRI